MTWEYTYRPTAQKEGGRQLASSTAAPPVVPRDWALALRQADEEEGACRRPIVADEAIERQRLLRLLQGRCPVIGRPSTENEERGIRLLNAKDYAGAYVCFSRALRQNSQSKLACCKRALCSWHLFLYDECIEDCQKCLQLDPDLVTLLCRSLLFRERYEEAREWYDHALREMAPTLDDPYNIKWRAECEAIPALRRFRSSVEQKKWEETLRVKDAAKPLVDGSPLVVLEARVLLHVNPTTARLRLLSYVPTIARPLSSNTEMSPEEVAAWRCVEEHYLQACVLLAQANAYCGSQFLALAAALIQTCLTISPGFGPALLLGHYLVSLEEILSRVATLFGQQRYSEAIPLIHNGLNLDKSNRLMCSSLHCLRAEAYAHLGEHLRTISDCTAAIERDPSSARAYVLRAEAHDKVGERALAAMDRRTAVRLSPALRHILRGDEDQFAPRPEPPRSPRGKQGPRKSRPRWYDAFMRNSEFVNEPRPLGSEVPKFWSYASHTTERTAPPRPTTTTTTTASSTTTLYDILELRRGAGVEEVRAQFKRLTLKYHPDRVVKETPKTQQAALERFKLINHAHEVLSDPNEKFHYDLSLGIRAPANF
ncbi:putative TPR-repeat-containing chaperone protein DNAJ,putative [Trypanosoma grayi]|uniref:putative TPR-repeat-containing chaperone protein DNAJ,putative n=1 Tax=Trypanosoma grayi TaxID=71804 RepID=UPI0004F44BEB|nr:putative TPR-repeat-containing chaperone protein DNAJ,putative [Trypanosoma grayi]KEG14253.1 putative TPR-repeat-containing chaperone protein DNAJ,putative [Trypanosoma grayi]